MILLSEVVERVLVEIQNWPSSASTKIHVQQAPQLKDGRQGHYPILVESLSILAALGGVNHPLTAISLDGNDDDVRFSYSFNQQPVAHRDWSGFEAKMADFRPRIVANHDELNLLLWLPAAQAPPLDLEAVVRETGLNMVEATDLARSMAAESRVRLDLLRRSPERVPIDERHRAAHALRGTGKTLRAQNLAEAARVVEEQIREGQEPQGLALLEHAWLEIEHWLEGADR